MNKLLFYILIFCFAGATNSYAQLDRKLHYGINAGGGLGIQSINNPSVTGNTAIRTFNAEALVYIPVLKQYFIRTGVGFQNKGTIFEEDALTTTNKLRYIELPVALIRKFHVQTLGDVVLGAGGYLAQGLSGSIHYETPSSDNFNKVTFGNDADFQLYDGGLRFVSGLELNNRLTFNLGYDLGLYNIASQTLKDAGYTSVYNRQFTMTLGLVF
ncbi:outer membrane beta-barrel protein [Mucilaginibacter myungsuensis]|uniref:Outer membrane beta-barrel protein n=1 Tax=Mucilaginibacter myungsuensis TaxID=649104 RepID=A0A929PXI9_9SPHI|nr:outer membrane beta-barrel protein [Mucilaginibacter myungsuensis]MBE9662450.1 outer membrane beta-barrel protein [Mucilaginibacter myungsuensis]MDN3597870.1 outer membrane beta-barrel protein [Mucilaginibacter myungsuensis]